MSLRPDTGSHVSDTPPAPPLIPMNLNDSARNNVDQANDDTAIIYSATNAIAERASIKVVPNDANFNRCASVCEEEPIQAAPSEANLNRESPNEQGQQQAAASVSAAANAEAQDKTFDHKVAVVITDGSYHGTAIAQLQMCLELSKFEVSLEKSENCNSERIWSVIESCIKGIVNDGTFLIVLVVRGFRREDKGYKQVKRKLSKLKLDFCQLTFVDVEPEEEQLGDDAEANPRSPLLQSEHGHRSLLCACCKYSPPKLHAHYFSGRHAQVDAMLQSVAAPSSAESCVIPELREEWQLHVNSVPSYTELHNKVQEIQTSCGNRELLISQGESTRRALIIHNVIFAKDKPRHVSPLDSIKLTDSLNRIGYKVSVRSNVSAQKLLEVVEEFARATDHGDTCIVVFMSHGMQDGINGADSVFVSEAKILGTIDASESLKGKQKLVIFQACRDGTKGHGLPNYPNMIIAHSTSSRNFALKHDIFGAKFIQCLCKVFDHLTHSSLRYDIGSLITGVNFLMMNCRFSAKDDASKVDDVRLSQLPCWFVKTDGKFYLRRPNDSQGNSSSSSSTGHSHSERIKSLIELIKKAADEMNRQMRDF